MNPNENNPSSSVPAANEQIPATDFNELYKELTSPKDFTIALTCPECGAPTSEDGCKECITKSQSTAKGKMWAVAGDHVSTVLIILGCVMPVFCGALGALFFGRTGAIFGVIIGFGLAKSWINEIRQGRAAEHGLRAAPLSMAKRNHSNPKAYDYIAVIYLRWLTGVGVKFIPPDGFVDFLRDYRNSANVNVKLREELFDTLLAQVCGLLLLDNPNWRLLFDAGFTGSTKQRAIIKSFIVWRRHDPYYIKAIAEVEKAHEAGVDLRGVDFRLPPATEMFKQLRDASITRDGKNANLCLLASRSTAYCDDLAEKIKKLMWTEREQVARLIQASSVPLASELAKSLMRKPKGPAHQRVTGLVAIGFALLFFLGIFALGVFIDGANKNWSWRKPVGVLLLAPGCLCWLIAAIMSGSARRDRQRNKQIAELLSGIPKH